MYPVVKYATGNSRGQKEEAKQRQPLLVVTPLLLLEFEVKCTYDFEEKAECQLPAYMLYFDKGYIHAGKTEAEGKGAAHY